MTYYYPDISDLITLTIIQSKNLDVEYLEKTENTILSSAEQLFKEKAFKSLLDLGCGAGRLTIKFSEYFDRVTALDPDRQRLSNAKKNILSKDIQNVVFVQAPFLGADFPDNHFDAVLCNQILQHIDTEMIEPMIQGIFRVLKSKGILVLTTSCSNRGEDFFLKAFLENGKTTGIDISEEEFNRLIINDRKILPIHYFSPVRLKKYLDRFTEIELSTFYHLYPHPMLDALLFIGQKE